MDLNKSRERAVFIFAMYCMQGLVSAFLAVALFNHLLAHGSSLTSVARFASVATIPWMFQFVWGPVLDQLVDFRMGRRRFWIVLSNVFSLFALASLLWIKDPAQNLVWLSVVFFLHSICASVSDLGVDALVIDRVPEAELGRTSAVSRIGFTLGSAASAAFFAHGLAAWGFQICAGILVALWAVLTMVAVISKEQSEDTVISVSANRVQKISLSSTGELFRKLYSAFTQPRPLLLLLTCFFLDFAATLFQNVYNASLIQNQHWSQVHLSDLQAAFALAGGTVGALAIGFLCDRAGYARVLTVLLLFGCGFFIFLGFHISSPGSGHLAWMGVAVGDMLPTLLYVAIVPALMDATETTVGASQFTFFMTAMNAGDIAAGWLAGPAMNAVTVNKLAFVTAGIFAVAGLLLRGWRAPSQARAVEIGHNILVAQ